ncbi:acylphosphatase [Acidimangrovimonas pyrenivorans]|uniref:Acylphosphatase n=1 Tax=Acidimangrovimonas pyrenivorans TaxID=2030798 RepID=A0ABV7AIX3_9RHOB
MTRVAITARITGRVQGVSFRAWTEIEANRLGLDGWVRNQPDGSVLALIAGPAEAVTLMKERLSSGPPHARVETVEAEIAEDPGRTGFRITF